ncbi:MAG: hypothetical protein WCK83_14250 [Burkholderiales bacterium]
MTAKGHGLPRRCAPRNDGPCVITVPVAPAETLEKIRSMTDEVVCLEVPPHFQAVGQFYDQFPQIDDAEVAAALADAKQPDDPMGKPR